MAAQKQDSSNKLLLIVVILVVVVLGGGFLVGSLGRRGKKEVAKPGVVTEEVPEIPDNVSKGSIEDVSGGFELERGGLRAFPRDFPTYPDALVASSWDPRSELPFEGNTVAFTAEGATVGDVAVYYDTELRDTGWTVTSATIDTSPATLMFEKGQTKGYIWVGSEDGDTVITVTVASK